MFMVERERERGNYEKKRVLIIIIITSNQVSK